MKPATITQIFKPILATGIALALLAGTSLAQASLVIGATRVIYTGDAAEVTVKLSNEGQVPALAQAWIDNGDPDAPPSTIATPFTLTPPVSRIDPHKAQTLRIFRMDDALPKEHESVFYLNVLEIPPKPSADEANPNHLQIAFRTRIKLFYRPQGLRSVSSDAPRQLTWHASHEGGKPSLTVENPTPYYVTIASFEVMGPSGATVARSLDSDMIAPGSSKTLLASADATPSGKTVRFRSINDYGGEDESEAQIR
jgi:P pilus assembly chaperone PapD